MSEERFANKFIEVAIVGGGASGLYSGWRLRTQNSPSDVALFEMSDRLGGRLYTVSDFAGTGVHQELGGMRYLTHQKMVAGLITEFSLPTEDFPVVDQDENFFYMRRQRFRLPQWGDGTANPRYYPTDYARENGSPTGRLLTADEIFGKLTDEILLENGITERPADRQAWDAVKPLLECKRGPDRGELLLNIGFWNLLEGMVDGEAYEICAQAGGYYSNTINWNAAEALPYIIGDFGGETSYETISTGMEALPDELAARYTAAGGEVFMEHRLVSLDIETEIAQPYNNILVFEVGGDPNNTYTVRATHVIFGMPRRSLELFDWPESLWNDLDFRLNLISVIGDPAFKLLMAFDYEAGADGPWWKEKCGITGGRSLTDLPMRQCYYFDDLPAQRKAILLATYNDMRTVSFWQTLEQIGVESTELKRLAQAKGVGNRMEERRFKPKWDKLKKGLEGRADVEQAPERMVSHGLNQLEKLHGISDIPEPYYTAFKNWGHDPYGGGYHAWKANYDVGAVMQYMRKPFASHFLYVVGEAYSDQQGWVEGAFCIAEQMLQESFDLAWPDWLDPTYYLGR